MVEVRDPQFVLDYAQRETFTQESLRVLDLALKQIRKSRESGDVVAAIAWWHAGATLNRAMTDIGFIRTAEGIERETRVAMLLAKAFGKGQVMPYVDFDEIAAYAVAALPVDYDRAAARAPRWMELDHAEILRLRDAISSLERLVPYTDQVARIPHWDDWQALTHDLP